VEELLQPAPVLHAFGRVVGGVVGVEDRYLLLGLPLAPTGSYEERVRGRFWDEGTEGEVRLPGAGVGAAVDERRPLDGLQVDGEAGLFQVLSCHYAHAVEELVLVTGEDADRRTVVAGFREESFGELRIVVVVVFRPRIRVELAALRVVAAFEGEELGVAVAGDEHRL